SRAMRGTWLPWRRTSALPEPCERDVRVQVAIGAHDAGRKASLATEADPLIETEGAMIGFLGDQLDPRDVRMVSYDRVEQPLEQLPPDTQPLREGMHRHREFSQHVAEDPELAPVGMQFTGKPWQSLEF